jgi:glycosyltransferase involved in cell wall biosynthesis
MQKSDKMKRIKLAYICLRFSPELGGPFYSLFMELSKYIDIVCIAAGQEYSIKKVIKKEIINSHFKIRRFDYIQPLIFNKDIIVPTNLKKILDEEKPDIVQSDEFFRFTSIQAAVWCKKNKVPFILSSRMRYRPGILRNFILWLFKLMARNAVKEAKVIVSTQGKCSEEEFLRWFPEKKNIVTASSGIDFKKFKHTNKKQIEKFRKKYKIPPYKKIILNVARIYPVKRIDLLIQVFDLVKKIYNDLVLVIIGSAEEKEKKKIEKIIENLNLKIGEDVFFTGGIPNKELGPAYANSTVFVNTSETEGICFSFLEAMCFKLPIVAFDVGGNSGVIEHGKNGYLVKFGDIESMAKKILKILQDEDEKLRDKLGNYGYKKVQKEFDIKIIAKKLVNLYKTLIK